MHTVYEVRQGGRFSSRHWIVVEIMPGFSYEATVLETNDKARAESFARELNDCIKSVTPR